MLYNIHVYSVWVGETVAQRSEGKKLQYYIIVDSSEKKVISPGSPVVTLHEQRFLTYFKLLELKH